MKTFPLKIKRGRAVRVCQVPVLVPDRRARTFDTLRKPLIKPGSRFRQARIIRLRPKGTKKKSKSTQLSHKGGCWNCWEEFLGFFFFLFSVTELSARYVILSFGGRVWTPGVDPRREELGWSLWTSQSRYEVLIRCSTSGLILFVRVSSAEEPEEPLRKRHWFH